MLTCSEANRLDQGHRVDRDSESSVSIINIVCLLEELAGFLAACYSAVTSFLIWNELNLITLQMRFGGKTFDDINTDILLFL